MHVAPSTSIYIPKVRNVGLQARSNPIHCGNRRRSHCYIDAIRVIHKICDSKWGIGDRCGLVFSWRRDPRLGEEDA